MKGTPDVARASGNSTVRDEAQTRQGAILDAYLFLACQQPAALKSRIQLARKIESCNCAMPVPSDCERASGT